MSDTDVKDLQYTVVKSRRKAIDLITDIYDAKAKTMIKSIKDIENGHINPGKSYKSLNVDDLRRSFKSNGSMEEKGLDHIADIRGALKILRKPTL